MTLVAWSERVTCDPMTSADGVLRKEWRVRLLGEPGISYSEVLAKFRRVGEWVMELRYLRRGKDFLVDEGWQMHDTCDDLDELLAVVDKDAVAVHPRLMELRGEWTAAREQREADERARAERVAREKAEREAKHRAAMAFQRIQATTNPRMRALWDRWVRHVEAVRADEGLQLELGGKDEFLATGRPVYEADTIPAIAKAMRLHLDRWESYVAEELRKRGVPTTQENQQNPS